MRNFMRWTALVLAAIAVVAMLPPPAHAAATGLHQFTPYLVPFAIGLATTGTETGSDFSGLNDMLKQVYSKPFENNVEKDSEVADFIDSAEDGSFEVTDGPDGKQINLGHIFSSGGGVGAMTEDDYLYTPSNPTTKQSSITIKQLVAIVQLSGRTMRRVKKGPAAFVTWADEALPRKAQRLAFQKDRMYLGCQNGIICQYTVASPSGTTDTIGNAFGISGLEGATNLLLRDDQFRCGPNANGTSLRTGTALVGSVDYVNSALNTTVSGTTNAPTSAAQNDYLFLGDNNVQGIGTREIMGFEGGIDDGTNVPTFQGLSRTTYMELQAQIIDSSASGYTQSLTEEIMDYADTLAFERGDMGRPSRILVNRSGQRSFWKSLKADREINDPRGNYQGGLNRGELKMLLGDRMVRVRAARKVPLSRVYGIDPTSILRFRIGAGRWDDTDGSVWNRVVDGTGRKDAFFAVYVEEEEVGYGAPAKNFKITKLASA